MALSLQQFLDRVHASGLLSPEDLQPLLESLSGDARPQDGAQLARLLVKQKLLTAYQAEEIYAGRGASLVLGNYVILDKLGQGGMGMVLKAEHRRMERLVALKVLSPKVTKSPEALARFQREVKAAAKLSHPHIVIAHDADEAGGTHFLVMEYVEGIDLAALVREQGPLAVEQAVACVLQAARGLEYAHGRGVVHRDIKPANLLLDRAGTVKILDMGLARLDTAGADQDQLTGTGQIMGTIDYMAPEQAVNTKHADARADIYALGITLWYLLTGRAAYAGESVMEKLLAHRESPIPSLAAACPEATAPLEEIFARMVAKRPEDRYPSMGEVIAALESLAHGSRNAPALGSEPGDDSRLRAFLGNLEQPSAGPAATVTVAPKKQPTSTASGEQPTEALQSIQIDTDPETQMSLAQPATASSRAAPPRARGEGAQRRAKPSGSKFPRSRVAVFGAVGGGAALLVLAAIVFAVWSGAGTNGPSGPNKLPPPPAAIAPFDATEAKRLQQAWADYLGLPVEKEITLPGGENLTLVLIPPGEFLMGSSDEVRATFLEEARAAAGAQLAIDQLIPAEGPQHRVRITQPFYLGKYEVTQSQWQSVMGRNPSRFKDSPLHPVDQVHWNDIQPFLAKLNANGSSEKLNFALPTEAEWEYACRAGTTSTYSFGHDTADFMEYGWSVGNAVDKTHPVGRLQHNGFGLYDMHGNVWEWCQDWFAADYYKDSPVDNPSGPSAGSNRIIRGGSWYDGEAFCRSANRFHESPDDRSHRLGFRLSASILDMEGKLSAAGPVAGEATPLPAIAPFNESEAKRLQQAWADYLGVPVEKEITLPGGEKLTLVLVPPGEFLMGSTDAEQARFLEEAKAAGDTWAMDRIPAEGPQHRVRITKPFYLGKYEVTQAQWQSVMGSNPSNVQDSPLHPVEQVSWNDVQPFLAKMNESTAARNVKFVLPTEAQWEYACRSGTTSAYYGGDREEDLIQYGWSSANSGGKTQPVGELKPNAFDVFDMHGNVWEWCEDWHARDFDTKAPVDDPSGPSSGLYRVRRGGYCGDPARYCRSSYRYDRSTEGRFAYLGFRLAAAIELPAASAAGSP